MHIQAASRHLEARGHIGLSEPLERAAVAGEAEQKWIGAREAFGFRMEKALRYGD